MKRWPQRVKKQLIRDAVAAAQIALRLEQWQLTVAFDNKAEYRATCEAEPQYQTAKLTFAPKRIEIYECVEFGCHEPAHIVTWPVAVMLERAAGADPQAMEDAEEAYEKLTTDIGHIVFPLVVAKLEAEGKLPAEAKEIPLILDAPKQRKKAALDKTLVAV